MYYNNKNRQQDDDDLKFMPLNIREPFLDKDSSWFPVIDMALPDFSELPNSFLSGFSTPVDNSNLEGNSLKTLDLIQNNNLNVQNLDNNQSAEEFTKDFNLEYPSETLEEELYSYNKDKKCKSINDSTNNINMQNMKNNSGNMSGMNNVNMQGNNMGNMNSGNENINGMNMNNRKTQSYNSNYGNTQDEPIHMNLLRSFNFESFLDGKYRGESGSLIEEIDRIFNIVKNDSSITQTFKAYNIPKPISDLIIKKIIKITLENSK
jgi:hypothetical protein